MNKVLITICFIFLLVICNKNKEDKYQPIITYINTNEEIFLRNGLKGIEALNLLEEQEAYYLARIKYFSMLLSGDNSFYEKYCEEEKKYYRMFPLESKYYFYWSKDIIDSQISHRIKEKFGDVLIPLTVMDQFHKQTPGLYSNTN